MSPVPTRQAAVAAIALATLLPACATHAPREEGYPVRPRVIARAGSDPITAAELRGLEALSAYEAIARLRANFLRSRGPTTLGRADGGAWPIVFIDGMRLGPIGELRSIPASDLREVRLLNGAEAQFRFGTGYPAGVILLSTRFR